jgi:UDP-N-acetylglucosamine transferase subunit ALG13
LIFTTVGTHEQQFDRLVKAVDNLDTTHERVVQFGYSTYKTRHCKAEKFLPFEAVRDYILSADVVITHSGTGSVMLALSLGKKPIVAPRYKSLGEHVDDHQLQLAQQLESEDLIVPYYEGDELGARIRQILSGATLSRNIETDVRLIQDLKQYIDQ